MLFIILEVRSRFIYLIGGSISCSRATLVVSTDIHQRAMLMKVYESIRQAKQSRLAAHQEFRDVSVKNNILLLAVDSLWI